MTGPHPGAQNLGLAGLGRILGDGGGGSVYAATMAGCGSWGPEWEVQMKNRRDGLK